MARTPLMSALQRIAAQLRAARSRGVSIDDLRGEAQSRREFLRTTAVAAAAVGTAGAFGGSAFAAPSAFGGKAKPEIAIIGAGLAGLFAAYQLKRSGVKSVVYEASSRVGGRTFSNSTTFASGQVAEHGGELIDTGHVRMRALAKHLGLKLDDLHAAESPGTGPLYFFDGAPYTEQQVAADFGAIFNKLQIDVDGAGYPTLYKSFTPEGAALDVMSIEEWIESRVPGGNASRLGRLLSVAYVIEYGAEASDQSALNLLYLLGFDSTPEAFAIFGASDERFHIRGGNEQVAQQLALRLPTPVQLGHRLIAAESQTNGKVRLTFDTGGGPKEIFADRVLMALPFSVLRAAVDLENLQLSPRKRTAIAQLGMGTNTKIQAQFTGRLWRDLGCNGETFAETGYQATWEASRAQSGAEGVLVDFTGGVHGASFARASASEAAQQFLKQIEPALPGLSATWNGRALLDYWPGSPFQLGSYSYWRVGQYTAFAGVEAEREKNVYFAGEHTSIDFQGFMEGAVRTGRRAALEILHSLGAPLPF